MAAVTFDAFYFSLVVFLSALIPGIAVGWPLLRKSALSFTEKLFSSFFLGVLIVPLMLVLENTAGIGFSLNLVYMNLLLVLAAGAFMWFNSALYREITLPDFGKTFSASNWKALAAGALLISFALLSFWLRVQTFSPIYSELDPYYYVYGTGQIIRDGSIPYPGQEDTSWWPEIRTQTHRNDPSFKMFLEAEWYALYTGGGAYNNYLLFITSSWLPPLSGLLMAFGAYLLFTSYFGRRYGLLAAFLCAVVPVMMFKMAAGVNEAGPFGMASIFFVLGFYAAALRKNDLALGAIAGIAFAAAVLGSNYATVVTYPLSAFLVLQSAIHFLREDGKQHKQGEHAREHAKKGGIAPELMGIAKMPFIAISSLLVAGGACALAVEVVYENGIAGLPNLMSGAFLLPLAGLAAAFAIEYANQQGIPAQRKYVLAGAAVAAALLVLILPNPLGAYAKGTVSEYVGQAGFSFPLDRTIAEQNLAGSNFQNEIGFLALVPSSLIEKSPVGLQQNVANIVYSALSLIAGVFTPIFNFLLTSSTFVFNKFLGLSITPVAKDPSLLFVFMLIALVGLAWDALVRNRRESASVALLLLLLLLPISFIGMNKVKYGMFVGIVAIAAATVALCELERAAGWLSRKMKAKGAEGAIFAAFSVAIFLLAYAQVALPPVYPDSSGETFSIMPDSYVAVIFSKSFEGRYQDNPAAAMPRLASACESLRAAGYYDEEICSAAYNESFADTIDSQYNSKVCIVSQLAMPELFPNASSFESQKASVEAKTAANYRCNRLAPYWVDSMEWISKNLDSGERTTSWWDYGHWINYFGDRKTVLRNEHASRGMIGRVAHDFLIGSNQDLRDSMNYFDSRYVLFDVEIIGGETFGGKYGALNYLGCAHEGETSVRQQQGTSECEFEHSPERIVVPKQQTASTTCVISESQQRTGVYAYGVGINGIDQTKPVYCIGEVTLATGEKLTGTYYLNRTDANGDLAVSKGFIRVVQDETNYVMAEMVYDDRKVWVGPDGSLVGGMEDAKTPFYTSNLYQGFYLRNLPGFELVYESSGGEVKIFRMVDFTGNKEGYVDPVAAAQTS